MSWLPVKKGERRVLDFDLEQRPLTYWTPDRPTGEITAIAWAWADDPKNVETVLLTPGTTPSEWREALLRFVAAYDRAGMVTGHYIRRFDLRQIQAALAEYGLPPLGPKLTQDTKSDLIGWGDLPKTQEYLSEMLGVPAPKIQMSQNSWRRANRLRVDGMELTRRRVEGDVRQHIKLRAALLKAGLLKSPRIWRP